MKHSHISGYRSPSPFQLDQNIGGVTSLMQVALFMQIFWVKIVFTNFLHFFCILRIVLSVLRTALFQGVSRTPYLCRLGFQCPDVNLRIESVLIRDNSKLSKKSDNIFLAVFQIKSSIAFIF